METADKLGIHNTSKYKTNICASRVELVNTETTVPLSPVNLAKQLMYITILLYMHLLSLIDLKSRKNIKKQ